MKVEDLKNTKIYLSNKEDRIKFQKKVFKLGVKWSEGNQSMADNTVVNMFFTIDNYLHLFSDWGKTSFINNTSKQIFLDEVLAIEEPKEECEFKPYDRVLVKKRDGEAWLATEFSNYDDTYPLYPYTATNSCGYKYCIPYSKDLDYIIGRTDIDIITAKSKK